MSVGTYSIGNKIVNKTNSNNQSWRLIHDDVDVIQIFQTSGYTETIYNIEIRGSEQLCIDRANALGLNFPDGWDGKLPEIIYPE